jgi:hypothetical protein
VRKRGPSEDPPARPAGGRGASFKGWLVDILVGSLIGSVIVGGLGQSLLLTARVAGSPMVAATLILSGSVLGIGFMRVVRLRAADSDRIRRPDGPRR